MLDSILPLQEAGLIDLVDSRHQLAHPEWSVTTDFDMEASAATRHRLFGELTDQDVLVIGTHWPKPTAGYVVRDGDAFKLKL